MRGRISRLVAAGSCLAVLATMASGVPARAAGHFQPPALQKLPPVPVQPVAALKPGADAAAERALHGPPSAASLPAAGTVTVALPGPAAAQVEARAGGLSLKLSAASGTPAAPGAGAVSRVQVQALDQSQAVKAGLKGVLFRAVRADGGSGSAPVSLSVSYAGFRNAYGGDWATRLALWSVPECALTTPGKAGCLPVANTSANDVQRGQVSGQILVGGQSAQAGAGPTTTSGASPARTATAARAAAQAARNAAAATGGALFALAAVPSGPVGDFTATSLAPSATWQSGGSSGDFMWNYPIRVPPA